MENVFGEQSSNTGGGCLNFYFANPLKNIRIYLFYLMKWQLSNDGPAQYLNSWPLDNCQHQKHFDAYFSYEEVLRKY